MNSRCRKASQYSHVINNSSELIDSWVDPCTTVQLTVFIFQQGSEVLFFTARCTLVQSAVLRSHVVCLSVRLSVRLSVTLVDCDHIGWNTSEIISPLISLGCSLSADPNIMGLLQGKHPKFGPKVTHPLLI